jgi:alpha-soluble NSF attachment protein
LNTTDLAIK